MARVIFSMSAALCLASCAADDAVGAHGTDVAAPTTAPTTAPATAPTTASTRATAVASTSSSTTDSLPVDDPPRSLAPLALDSAGFSSSIAELDPVVLDRVVGSSWSDDCPVPLDRLRYVQVTHRTPDGGTAIGELVVDEAVADEVVRAFEALFDADFPIESMRLVDDFDGDDLRSMQANNTSAFNCRFVAGTTTWSWHAYGRAIDINPLVNPYVTAAGVEPPEGAKFADRTQQMSGMIHAGDAVTNIFDVLGWDWGGSWSGGQDYQHFDRADG